MIAFSFFFNLHLIEFFNEDLKMKISWILKFSIRGITNWTPIKINFKIHLHMKSIVPVRVGASDQKYDHDHNHEHES